MIHFLFSINVDEINFDFFAGEFGVGLGSILAVRGEGILSWDGYDNFVVQDKTSGNQEVIYLTS
jgi:hypothetical protein